MNVSERAVRGRPRHGFGEGPQRCHIHGRSVVLMAADRSGGVQMSTIPEAHSESLPFERPDWLSTEHWPFPLSLLDLGGRRLAFADVGEGPTLVLVHAGMWSFVWRDLMSQLATTFRLVTLDAPGSGLSDPPAAPAQVGIDNGAQALAALVDHLGLERFVLVVHDLGGPVALEAAARWPDRVAGLVAVNSFGWRPSGVGFRAMLALMGSAPMREVDALTRWLPAASSTRFGVGRHWDRSTRRTYRRGMRAGGTRAFHRMMRSARGHDFTAIEEVVQHLERVPLLTVFGQRNDPLGSQSRWTERFRDVEQHEVRDGYHFPMCDDPSGIAEVIAAWHHRHLAATEG